VDCAGRLLLVRRFYKPAAASTTDLMPPLLAGGVGLAVAAAMPTTTAAVICGTLTLGVFAVLAWRSLPAPDRAALLGALRNPRSLLRREAK
jgi:hypothetical protein